MLDITTTQTNIYANQHKGLNSPATSEEIKVVISILLLSGYCRVPYRELYWSTSPDTHNESVSKAISRNRFREIFSNLHIRDNTDIDDDRYYKVRPLFDILNTNFKRFVSANNFSLNESMIPYFGRHGTNQFIKGKPIQFGFKFWCLLSSDEYLLNAEPYCGKDNDFPETGLGQGSDVVLGKIKKCDLTKGSTVAMNNFFTTLPLLEKLTDVSMYGVGTIRENRLQRAPLKKKAALQKETRRTFDYTSDGNNLLVAWKDNKVVIVATNYLSLNPVSSTKRWSKAEKKHVNVPMPNPFKEYNANIGGVDLCDQFVSTYRVRIRSKKWWWPFFAWSINAAAVNTWRLFRKIHGKVTLLKFLHELVLETLGK